MSEDSAQAIIDERAAAARRAMGSEEREVGSNGLSGHQSVDVDTFLDPYFKRIDPEIAASFSTQQCEAMKDMFGARIRRHHALDFRPTLALGRSRFYLVLLAGRDRRILPRAKSPNAAMLLVALALVTLVLLPVLAVA